MTKVKQLYNKVKQVKRKKGVMDKVRISNIFRPASWIKATYYSERYSV